MRSSHCYWRFVIFTCLVSFYCLLIYASIKPHPEKTVDTTPLSPKPTISMRPVIEDERSSIERKVTALVKVHKRADIAVRAAFSVHELYPKMEILMVDDSPTPITQKLPPTVKYFRIPENTGISYGRNYGVNNTHTEYLLIMDDDWIVTNLSHLNEAFQLLESNRSIGLVAGFLCRTEPMDSCYGYQGSIGIIDGLLTYKDKDAREDMGNGCKIVDLGENVILARTAVLKQYPWDNQLINAEHEDFYLSMKGHVLVASCGWFKILHKRPGLADYKGYVEDRDLNANQDRLCKKWSLRGFNMMYTEWQRPCPQA